MKIRIEKSVDKMAGKPPMFETEDLNARVVIEWAGGAVFSIQRSAGGELTIRKLDDNHINGPHLGIEPRAANEARIL